MAACRVLLIVSTALFAGAAAPSKIPDGWRAPTTAEAVQWQAQARRFGGPSEQVLSIRADFDGDGRADHATILVNERNSLFGVFVARAADANYFALDGGGDLQQAWNYSLQQLDPGSFEPACVRGLGDDTAACRGRFEVRSPSIGFYQAEGFSVILFWDGGKFDSELLSD